MRDHERRKKIGTKWKGRFYTEEDFNRETNHIQEAIKRQGQNHGIQCLAAEIMKRAMYYVDQELVRQKLYKLIGPCGRIIGAEYGASISNQVHDELVVMADDGLEERVAKIVEDAFLRAESEVIPSVPASASVHIGDSWASK